MKTIGTVGMVVIYPMHAAYNILKKGWLQWILPIIFWCIAIWNGFMMYGLYKKEDMILFLFALCWDFAVMRALYVAMEFANRFIFEKLEMFIGGIERGYRICEKWSREKKLTGKERREIENSKIETYIQMRENIDFEDRKQRAWLAETSRQQRAQLAEHGQKGKSKASGSKKSAKNEAGRRGVDEKFKSYKLGQNRRGIGSIVSEERVRIRRDKREISISFEIVSSRYRSRRSEECKDL